MAYLVLTANNFDLNIEAALCETKEAARQKLRETFLSTLKARNIVPGEDGFPNFPESTEILEFCQDGVEANYSDTAWSVSGDGDLTYAQLKKMQNPGQTDIPDAFLLVSLIRVRSSENDIWTDDLVFPINEEEWKKLSADEAAAKPFILSRLCAALANADGWAEIVNASCDYNWGDAIMGTLSRIAGKPKNFDNHGRPVIYAKCIVNQDELIAPENVPVTFRLTAGDAVQEVEATLCMLNGYVTPTEDLSTGKTDPIFDYVADSPVSAEVVFADGSTVKCDPEEDFLRLVQK